MPAKTADLDPATLKGWLADARKKPVSFAMLAGPKGIVMQADKVKSPDQMRKAAKSAGGGKGCWGKMTVQQKVLMLVYEGNPPGGFDKQVRKMLADAGSPMQVQMQSADEAGGDGQEQADADTTSDLQNDTAALEEGEDEEDDAALDEDGEPLDLGATIQLARKKPLNFACMLSDEGVALVTDRRKQWGILVKQAKSAGGSAKGGWGTLAVEGKVVVLNCVEDPPGTLARRLKLYLKANGQKFAVEIRSPSGTTHEPEEDADTATDDAPAPRGADGSATRDRSPGDAPESDALGGELSEEEHEAQRKAYIKLRFEEISSELAVHFSKKDMQQFKAPRMEIMQALKTGDLDTAQRLTAQLFSALQDAEHRALTLMSTDLEPARAAELESWVGANFMAEEGGLEVGGVRLGADEVGGERLAAALKGASDLGNLTEQERDYITLRILRKWVHTPGTGEDGADENIDELTAAMKDAPPELRERLATLYWETHTQNMLFKVGEDNGLDTHPAFEKRDLSMQLMENTIDLNPTGATQELAMTVGGQGLAQLAMGQYRKQSIAGTNMVYEDMKNPYFDAFSDEHRRTLIREVADGALGNVEQSDAFMSFMFGGTYEDGVEDPADQAAWADALSKTLARNNCLVPRLAGETEERLKGALATEGGRELLFNGQVPEPMRNWALNHFAPSPDDWTRQPWTAEDVKDGWESETVAQAYAAPILDEAAKQFPEPVAFDLKENKGDLARNFALSFGLPPNLPYKDGETKEQYQQRLAQTDPDKLYDPSLPPLKNFFEHVGELEDGGATEAKITPIPITYTSNDSGAKVLKVIRLEREGQGPLFFDHINNRYRDVQHWVEENKLPEGKVTYPRDMELGNPPVTVATPGNKIADAAMMALDVTVMAVGTVAGVAAMVGTGGAATPLVIAGLAALYGAGRAGKELYDKDDLGHDTMDLSDPQIRALWLELGSSALSIGALGGGMRATSLIAKGTRMSKMGANVVAGMTVAGNLTDAVAMGDSMLQLEQNWEKMSPEHRNMALLQLSFQVGMHGASAKAGGGKYVDSFDFKKTRNQLEWGTPHTVMKAGADDTDIDPGGIAVKYDKASPPDKPYPDNFRIVYNGEPPTQAQIHLHAQAASAMDASVKMQKRYKDLNNGTEPEAGSAAWEAQFELTKIQGEANLVREKLNSGALTEEESARLQSRLDELNSALIVEQARLDQWDARKGVTGPDGAGLVAAPSGGESQRIGKDWPEAPKGYHWVASPDGTPFIRKSRGTDGDRLWYDPDKKAFILHADRPDVGMTVVGHGENEMMFLARGDGKTAEAHATLRKYHINAERSAEELAAQKTVGGQGHDTDDAGHSIGHRFGLDQGMDNLFPQDSNFNRGAYKKMENEFADWIAAGAEVRVSVTVDQFDGDRPARWTVSYVVTDPQTGKEVFDNLKRFKNNDKQTFDRKSSSDIADIIEANRAAEAVQ
ncbi:MAG: DUF4781 domain-containing protein [Pseudomonadota bacterium]